ncbi:DUF4019 domain-containing protein [Aeromonas sp. sif2416]|uniref:DUF4019 domain-containing protein n=1 Tax=Aeromonas sp. sif2416 TaxID=2854793 RepID=UPI001C4848ED|nr:DUF4019 domain-containing protein [Aeromonas sp. sif2416]MBV7439681.1 DUF4019 domain-containing protein [Aeromonas sp. sif2416]
MALTTQNIEKIAVFAFGVIFLSTILVLVVLNPTPTNVQFFAFRLTMALSAAGIGALLPGFLRLDIPLPIQGGVRASGALALFASVWFVNPATLNIEVIPPKESADRLITQFLVLTDTRDYASAYALYAKRNKERVSKDTYMSMSRQIRDPLGEAGQRVLTSARTPDELNGVRGPFVVHTYQSKFSDSKELWTESVSTIPENGVWKIDSYYIARCESPFCQPLASLLP